MVGNIGRSRSVSALVLALFVASVYAAPARDDPEAKRRVEAKKRLEFMRAAVGSLEPESSELNPKVALAAAPEPLLRYSDPTRGGVKVESANNVLVDAGVWRLGAEGRPTALVTTEVYQAPDGSRVMSYEFLSLTEKKFVLKHTAEAVRWDATASGLELKDLPDAPKPAATAGARLAQMRQLARRFGAKETYFQEKVECRLIAQPIDRYQSEGDKIVDGAIFALANGTNPEIGIVLECDGQRWVYGVLRLSAAESSVTLDGKAVAAYEAHKSGASHDGPYTSGGYKIGAGK